MVTKQVLDTVLRRITSGGVAVHYWDGDKRTYGPQPPYLTVTIRQPRAARAILRHLSLGFGEAYMDGSIEVDGSLEDVGRLTAENRDLFGGLLQLRGRRRPQTRARQRRQIAHHYDLGNDFYRLWLDTSLTYSCAYFREPADTLETAQRQKVAYLLRKLQLREGQRVLDIGSGWGTLLITAAREYGVHGLGVTLSEEQLKHARQAAQDAGVADRISFELTNYRDLAPRGERFDRIISVGMFEHVGRGNHGDYYDAVAAMLADDGISVLHTISSETEEPMNPWIDKYIFPGGYIPSTREVVAALPRYDLRLLDYENLRLHYAMTLEEWRRRYLRHRDEVTAMFDERFFRMWDLWLASSAAAFRYGTYNLSQYVLSKGVNNELPLTREAQHRLS